ncbi:MAG: hypothetical protein R3F31_07705 [Verrucomicrobiales bacterium]
MNPLPTIDGLDLRLVLSHVDDLAGAVAGRPQWGGLAKADQAAAAAEALRFRALGRELGASPRSRNRSPPAVKPAKRWKSCCARLRCL